MRGFSQLRAFEADEHAKRASIDKRVVFNGTSLTIQSQRRSDASGIFIVPLDELRLPPTAWAPQGTRVIDRPDLTDAIIGAVRVYLTRTGESKSTELNIRSIVNCMAKLFEFGWLHGAFKISDWTEENAMALRELLSSGGWQKALQLESRAHSLLQQTHVESAMRFVNKSGGISNEFFAALGSNVNVKEFAGNARLVEIALSLTLKKGSVSNSSQGMGQSLLRQTMGWINLLADVPGPSGLRFTPFENSFKQSKKHGRPGGRTSNLAPEEVGQLLKEANKWIYSHSKPILELFKEMSTVAGQAPDLQAEQNQLRKVLAHSTKKQEILNLLNVNDVVLRRAAYAHSEELSVRQLAQALFDACFIVIGFYNARRAGEIVDPMYGLYYDALQPFDPALGLYECDFYLEKYRKDYKKFFVNKGTVDAIGILKEMSKLAIELRIQRGWVSGEGGHPKERKVCQIPQFDAPRETTPKWFVFNAGLDGASRFFFIRAMGADASWHVRPHMLRRAYALIMHYRYENSELMAVSFQLDHVASGVNETITYLTNPSKADGRVKLERFGPPSERVNLLMQKEQFGLDAELKLVAHEKLHQFVSDLLAGTNKTSGGLSRLMLKFHQKLSGRLDYASLDIVKKVDALVLAVESRGQTLRPYPHGDCGAPTEKRARIARCFDEKNGVLDRAKASPETCHKCPFHRASAGHVEGLKREKLWISARLSELPAGMLRNKHSQDLTNLDKVITFHEKRLGATA
jgi:hypothetical protein